MYRHQKEPANVEAFAAADEIWAAMDGPEDLWEDEAILLSLIKKQIHDAAERAGAASTDSCSMFLH